MSKGGQQVGPSVGPIARLKDENRDLKLKLRHVLDNGADDLLKMKEHYEAKMARLTKENRHLTFEVGRKIDERERVKDSLATMRFNIADLLKDVERLKKEAFDYRDGFIEANAELVLLREVLEAAEAVEGPGEWVHDDLKPAVTKLHWAIRKAKGM